MLSHGPTPSGLAQEILRMNVIRDTSMAGLRLRVGAPSGVPVAGDPCPS
jgi:hypothetical protein